MDPSHLINTFSIPDGTKRGSQFLGANPHWLIMKVIPCLGTVVWLGADHLKTQSHLSIRISGSVISLTLLTNTFIQRVPFSHQGLFRTLRIPIEKRDSRYCRSWILVSSFSCGGTWCLDQIVDNAPNTSVYLLVSVVGIIHVLPLVPYSPPSIWWEHLATIMKVWGGLWRSTSGVPSRLSVHTPAEQTLVREQLEPDPPGPEVSYYRLRSTAAGSPEECEVITGGGHSHQY